MKSVGLTPHPGQYLTGEIGAKQTVVSVGLSGASLAFGGAGLAGGNLALASNIVSRAFGYGSFGWEYFSPYLHKNKVPENYLAAEPRCQIAR